MKIVALLIAALALGAGSRLAADEAASTPEQQVLAFEKARWDACLAKDLPKLDAMLSEDLAYIHATGLSQDKKAYLADLASPAMTYHTCELIQPAAKVYGRTAVTHGIFRFSVTSHGQEIVGDAYYTGVYVSRKGQWQLVSWQTTRVAAPAAK